MNLLHTIPITIIALLGLTAVSLSISMPAEAHHDPNQQVRVACALGTSNCPQPQPGNTPIPIVCPFGVQNCPQPQPAHTPIPVVCPFGALNCPQPQPGNTQPPIVCPLGSYCPIPTPYPTTPVYYAIPTPLFQTNKLCSPGYEKYPDCFTFPGGAFNPVPARVTQQPIYNPQPTQPVLVPPSPQPTVNPNQLCSPGYERYPDCFVFPGGAFNPVPAKHQVQLSWWEQALYDFIY